MRNLLSTSIQFKATSQVLCKRLKLTSEKVICECFS